MTGGYTTLLLLTKTLINILKSIIYYEALPVLLLLPKRLLSKLNLTPAVLIASICHYCNPYFNRRFILHIFRTNYFIEFSYLPALPPGDLNSLRIKLSGGAIILNDFVKVDHRNDRTHYPLEHDQSLRLKSNLL